MGERSPARVQHEKKLYINDPMMWIMMFGLVSGVALDAISHRSGAIADQNIREIMTNILGRTIAVHIGNFGIPASLTTTAMLTKSLFERSNVLPEEERTLFDKALELSTLPIMAGIFALGLMVEILPENNQLVGDLVSTMSGIMFGKYASKLAISRFRRSRHIPFTVNNLHFLKDTPTRLDSIFSNSIPTSVNQIFPN